MLKQIHCDLYKVFHRFYFYIMALALGGLCILLNAVMANQGGKAYPVSFSWQFFASVLSYGLFLLPMLTEIVLAEENREHTLKNAVSFGAARGTLFVSKFVTSVILGVILIAVVLTFYCGSSLLLLPKDAAFTADMVRGFFERVGVACIVYMAALAVSAFLSILLRRNSLFIFAYYGTIFLTDYLFKLLKISFLNSYLLKTQFSAISSAQSMMQMQMPFLVSIVTLAVFTVFGLFVFKKQDVG